MDYGRNRLKVSLMYSQEYIQLLHSAMANIHQDRDLLLSSLLYYCGFLRQTPKFFTVVKPKIASRLDLAEFHSKDYLDLLEYHFITDINPKPSSACIGHSPEFISLLDLYGLTDDCPISINPKEREELWKYCCAVTGASIHGAKLLLLGDSDVVINWGGGRHHAHHNKAGGFCYVNDVVLSIKKMLKYKKRILYLDVDIHHADGVQQAFYDTNEVMTVSLHRYSPGFYPSNSGSSKECGKHNSLGVGYNLNLPLPRDLHDSDMLKICDLLLKNIVNEYNPDIVVLCVGADGLKDDRLVKNTCEGWSLTPECLAEFVRRVAGYCGGDEGNSDSRLRLRKLLVLGGGGYEPAITAKAWVLSTAAACEGARNGMVWRDLPKDIPRHEHFQRYGPSFELTGKLKGCDKYEPVNDNRIKCHDYENVMNIALNALQLSHLFLSKQKKDHEQNEYTFRDAFDYESDLNCYLQTKSKPIPSGRKDYKGESNI